MKYKISREKYKSFKRMNHHEIEKFVINLYNEGFNDGKEAATTKSIKPSDIAVAIAEVKGVGSKKAAEIMTVVSALFTGGEKKGEGA